MSVFASWFSRPSWHAWRRLAHFHSRLATRAPRTVCSEIVHMQRVSPQTSLHTMLCTLYSVYISGKLWTVATRQRSSLWIM